MSYITAYCIIYMYYQKNINIFYDLNLNKPKFNNQLVKKEHLKFSFLFLYISYRHLLNALIKCLDNILVSFHKSFKLCSNRREIRPATAISIFTRDDLYQHESHKWWEIQYYILKNQNWCDKKLFVCIKKGVSFCHKYILA